MVFIGTLDNLVVNIGDIAHIRDLVTGGAKPARNHIKNHHHACMAQVAKVVYGHAANVHTYGIWFYGGKSLFIAA